MKVEKIFLFILFLFYLFPLIGYGENMSGNLVEGIFYLDGTPISVSIEDGLIKTIERKSSATKILHSEIYFQQLDQRYFPAKESKINRSVLLGM